MYGSTALWPDRGQCRLHGAAADPHQREGLQRYCSRESGMTGDPEYVAEQIEPQSKTDSGNGADTGGSTPGYTPALWPVLDDAALYGLGGEVVSCIAPHTESDPVALLLTYLACFGNAIGRGPHYLVEDTRHFANLFVLLAGATAKARKGTSADRVRAI